MKPRLIPITLGIGLIFGCGVSHDTPEDGITLLSPRAQLIRLSIDLRGVHPSEAELTHISAHPDRYNDYVQRYLYDERFAGRMEEVFNYVLRTRTGETFFDPADAGLLAVSDEQVADSIGDEPLKLIRQIIDADLPWSEVVTAEYTMADPIVAAMWDLDYPDGATGWHQAYYQDGRPHAGVLSSTTLWSRYPSAGVNANRHRANTVSRIFLCDDYLSRPVSFSRSQVDALTTGDPNEVIRNTAICQSCHSSLDPLASHFFGFWWEIDGELDEQTLYRPEDETLWKDTHGRSPGFFGIPTANLTELGMRLSEDERFIDCAVETVFDGLTQRDTVDADWGELQQHRDVFVNRGLVIRDLVRSIVTSRMYLASQIEDKELEKRTTTLKKVSPRQLESIIFAKTQYNWTFGGRRALARNAQGLAVLAGGIDGRDVTTTSNEPGVGMLLIQERLAQAAAYHVAIHDLNIEREGEAILLKYVAHSDRPDTQAKAFETQIMELHRDILGIPLQAEIDEEGNVVETPLQVAELINLWKQLYSVEANPQVAWAGLIAVILRDPNLLFY